MPAHIPGVSLTSELELQFEQSCGLGMEHSLEVSRGNEDNCVKVKLPGNQI